MAVNVKIRVTIDKHVYKDVPLDIKPIQDAASGIADIASFAEKDHYVAYPADGGEDAEKEFIEWAYRLEYYIGLMTLFEIDKDHGIVTVRNVHVPHRVIEEWVDVHNIKLKFLSESKHPQEWQGVMFWFGTGEYVSQIWTKDAKLAMLFKLTFA